MRIATADVPTRSHQRALDRLAVAAGAVALVPLPILGISHPVSQLLVLIVVAAFIALSVPPGSPATTAARALGLGTASPSRGAALMVVGAVTAVLRWLLDRRALGGRGGLVFYATALRQYGVVDPAGRTHWATLVPLSAVVFAMILVDGLFYVGLVQRRLGLRIGWRAALAAQAALFGLVHAFSGPVTDVPYGIGAAIGGLAYGYVFRRFENHWLASAMLWVHVIGVFVLMLV